MIRHVALFRLTQDAPADTRERLEEALFQLAQTIDAIAQYDFGADLGLREGNFDFGVVADFENSGDFKIYAEHPNHQAFIQEVLTPVLAERVSIQFEL